MQFQRYKFTCVFELEKIEREIIMDSWVELMKETKDALASTSGTEAKSSYEYFKNVANDLCKQDWHFLKHEHNNMNEAVNYYMLNELFNKHEEIGSADDQLSLANAIELDEGLRQYCLDHSGQGQLFASLKYKKPFTELQELISQAVRLYEQRNQ